MLKYIVCILLIVNVFSGTDLYVGYAGKNNNFNTVQEAVNKAASVQKMSPPVLQFILLQELIVNKLWSKHHTSPL